MVDVNKSYHVTNAVAVNKIKICHGIYENQVTEAQLNGM